MFRFEEIAARRRYDFICVVGEYRNLDDINRGGGPNVDRFSSSFGTNVPETHTAFVVVRDGVAYASLMSGYDMSVAPPNAQQSCVPGRSARLVRATTDRPRSNYIRLEG